MSLGQKTALTRYGGWYPGHPEVYDRFMGDLRERSLALARDGAAHTDPVTQFDYGLQSDPEMFDLMNQIFLQVSPEETKVTDYKTLLYMLDLIIVAPPSLYVAEDDKGNVIGEPIGVPMLLVFDLISNTDAAHDLFRMPRFSIILKGVLDAWGEYLKSADSTKTLTDDDKEDTKGWFSETALAFLESDGRGEFNSTYVCPDENAVNRGFPSYDAFFTRQIKDGARPIITPPEDQNPIPIYSACESTVYRIQTDVQAHDQFWLKGQRYSLYDMLCRDEDNVNLFVKGTIYQAFLGPADYHRWHSPIDGTIIRAEVVEGSYYAVIPDAGAEEGDLDFKRGDPHGALIRSQPFLTASCPRAIIYIQADNQDIGVVAFIGVGMAEVSTCELSVESGRKVSVGDELGMFHFGGSTHVLIFGPQVTVTFADNVKVNNHVLVNSVLGGVTKNV